jgi:hypothetical protein
MAGTERTALTSPKLCPFWNIEDDSITFDSKYCLTGEITSKAKCSAFGDCGTLVSTRLSEQMKKILLTLLKAEEDLASVVKEPRYWHEEYGGLDVNDMREFIEPLERLPDVFHDGRPHL